MTKAALSVVVILALAASGNAAEKITKETVTSQGTERTYYLFVPDSGQGTSRRRSLSCCTAPVATERSWSSIGSPWRRRKASSLPVQTPSSATGGACATMGRCCCGTSSKRCRRTTRWTGERMYVFGHSAGAIHGISMGVLESEYFAAVAVHAGAVSPSVVPYIARAPRKIPIAVWVGTNDSSFPVRQVRESLELLNRQEFNVELTEIKGHTHYYYGRSSEINKAVWAFLQRQEPRQGSAVPGLRDAMADDAIIMMCVTHHAVAERYNEFLTHFRGRA